MLQSTYIPRAELSRVVGGEGEREREREREGKGRAADFRSSRKFLFGITRYSRYNIRRGVGGQGHGLLPFFFSSGLYMKNCCDSYAEPPGTAIESTAVN